MDHRPDLLAILEASTRPYLQQAAARLPRTVRIRLAAGGRDGLTSLGHVLPSRLILVDDAVPDLSAFALLREIRQERRTICTPVVLLIHSRDAGASRDAYGAGANSVIVMPQFEDDLLQLFTNVLLFWCTINRVPRWPENADVSG